MELRALLWYFGAKKSRDCGTVAFMSTKPQKGNQIQIDGEGRDEVWIAKLQFPGLD